MKRANRHRPKAHRERGSALLVSLMVIVGLSMLGLGFVAISETESTISVNERNGTQVQAIAETGARAVVEWFQDPQWARNLNFTPVNSNALIAAGGVKRTRTVTGYSGVYKPSVGSLLFDRPYRPAPENRFYGDVDHADVEFNRTNAAAQLTAINNALFGHDNRAAGRIQEIKIYAPPMVGATLVNGFWDFGERFGLATVQVIAEKWSRPAEGQGRLLARRTVRVVVGEFPMPIPGGPIQTQAAINFGGNFAIHWGEMTSYQTLISDGATQPDSSFPWANPYERPNFEFGYDDNVYPIPSGSPNWLAEVIGKTYDDPWFGSRSRGANNICAANCGTYAFNVDDTALVYSGFANQTTNTYPVSKLVSFPNIRYDVWKQIAYAGRGMRGVNYFVWDSDTGGFKKNGHGVAHPAAYWVNNLSGAQLGAGIYFFDTKDQRPPRADLTNLTPAMSWSSNDLKPWPFRMEGFIYFNAQQYGTTGMGSCCPAAEFNMPPEIFRDIGHRQWDTSTGDWRRDADNNIVVANAANSQWDFDDVDNDNEFDLVLSNADVTWVSNDPAATNRTSRRVIPWSAGCTTTTCSEPHEPYINFIYGDDTDDDLVARWEGTPTRRPKRAGVVCNAASSDTDCTSNKHDDTGAVVPISVLLDGILYNEGAYDSSGNAAYYGAVLIKGNVTATGTPDVWFNAELLKGTPPKNMPRVTIYSSETDEPIQ